MAGAVTRIPGESKMLKVFVIVRGGIVQAAHASDSRLEVEVIDLDDLEDAHDPEKERALEAAQSMPCVY
jgi:hypothetical protein